MPDLYVRDYVRVAGERHDTVSADVFTRGAGPKSDDIVFQRDVRVVVPRGASTGVIAQALTMKMNELQLASGAAGVTDTDAVAKLIAKSIRTVMRFLREARQA